MTYQLSRGPQSQPSSRINFIIADDQLGDLKAEAEKRELSLSFCMREAIHDWIEKQRRKSKESKK